VETIEQLPKPAIDSSNNSYNNINDRIYGLVENEPSAQLELTILI
jgi:hypothetical protein